MNPVHREEIDGQEDPIADPEQFGAPFVITHNKGSVRSAQKILPLDILIDSSF